MLIPVRFADFNKRVDHSTFIGEIGEAQNKPGQVYIGVIIGAKLADLGGMSFKPAPGEILRNLIAGIIQQRDILGAGSEGRELRFEYMTVGHNYLCQKFQNFLCDDRNQSPPPFCGLFTNLWAERQIFSS